MTPFRVHSVRFYSISPLPGHSLSYCPENQLLALSRQDNSIELWNMRCTPFLERSLPANEESSVEALAWAKGRLFSTGLRGVVLEYDLDRLCVKSQAAVTSVSAWCMEYNPVRNRLAVGTEDGFISLFEVTDEGLVYDKALDKQEGRILCLAWHSSGDIIVTGSSDTIRVWDVSSGHPQHRMTTGRSDRARETIVWSVAINNDFTVMSGDSRGKTSFWNAKTGALEDSYQTHKADVLAVHFSEEQNAGYSTGIDPVIMQFQPIAKEKGRPKWVKSFHRTFNSHDVRAITTIGKQFLCVGVDSNLIINDHPHRRVSKLPPIPHGEPVVIAPKARCVLLRYSDSLELWRLGDSSSHTTTSAILPLAQDPVKLLQLQTRDSECIRCCHVSASAGFIGYATVTRTRLYRLSVDGDRPALKRISRMPDGVEEAQHMRFFFDEAKDVDRLLIATDRGNVQILELEDDSVNLVQTVSKEALQMKAGISHLEVNAKGSFFTVSDYNGNVSVYDLANDRLHCRLPFYRDAPICSLAIHPRTDAIVVVYSNQHVVECHIKNGKYTKFSNGLNFPNSWKQRNATARGVLLDCSRNDLVMLYDEENICVIERSVADETEPLGKQQKKQDKSSADAPVTEVRVTKKYEYLLYLGAVSSEELVAVEVKPQTIEEKLPPSLRQKQFGAM